MPPKKSTPRPTWKKLLQELQTSNNVRTAVKAGKAISKMARPSHVPDLYALLQHESFFVREEAAQPLARLEGVRALPALFQALHRGEQDGHDNDGLTHTLIELFEAHKTQLAPLLLDMFKSPDPATRADAVWAAGFVAPKIPAQPLFDIYTSDPDPQVRVEAGGALQIFMDPAKGLDPKFAQSLDTFNGKWAWLDCEPQLKYIIQITGSTGICLQPNSPMFASGDVILKIGLVSGPAFVGQHLFTNGAWYTVTARREGDRLHLQGGSQIWQLQRVD